MPDVDFEAEGLLEDLEGEEREARLKLLEELHGEGVPVEELKRAVGESRLTLVPVDRALGGAEHLTAKEIADEVDLPVDVLLAHTRAAGLPQRDPEERQFTDEELESARMLKTFLEVGFEAEALLEVTRVFGEGMARAADAISELVGDTMLRPNDNEHDLALRLKQVAEELEPVLGREMDYLFRLHLRERLRGAAITRAELGSGQLQGSERMAIGFADLVGFTKLGEQLPPEEIGRVAGRLGKLAGDIAEPPVRLVKTIGDAAMLVAPEVEPLVAASLALVAAADEAGEEFPQLRSGVAFGDAIGRGGDWYGRPVNVASRITSIARPGSVLATNDAKEAAEDAFRWSFAGRKRLKGVKDPLPLYRARRGDDGGGENADD